MGLIRKTLSVGTLGVVSFRSKKERLRRAERSQGDAEASLQEEHAARLTAESRITRAEKRVKRASAESGRSAKRLERSERRSRRHRRSETTRDVLSGVEPIVRSGIESARSASADAAERSRRAGRRAGKAARRSTRRAKVAASSATEAAAPHIASVAARAGEAIDHLTGHDS